MGSYVDSKSNQSKWTIDAILQHMGFYTTTETTTENPNVMMREDNNTQSSEYIIIYHDELYIASIHLKRFFTHYKTNTRSIFIYKINIHMILVDEIFVRSRNILKSYMSMSICFSIRDYLLIYRFHLKLSSH